MEADSGEENEVNNAALVPKSSEMKNIMKTEGSDRELVARESQFRTLVPLNWCRCNRARYICRGSNFRHGVVWKFSERDVGSGVIFVI
ncbi:hypothetical protein TNCV_3007911 [Trichonephila clavipes]|nr:hypothetical protein TNCV_3007911 [Trichonephila clavipes]